MRVAKFQIGKIQMDAYLPENDVKAFSIFCMGLPSFPIQGDNQLLREFVELGIGCMVLQYQGTFESRGEFSFESCVDNVAMVAESLLKTNQLRDLWTEQIIDFKPKPVFLLGESFGASVALCAGSNLAVAGIVAMSGPTNYLDHNKKYSEEDLDHLAQIVERHFSHSWRIPKKGWEALTGSKLLSPEYYVEQLREKKILLLHCEKDSVVSVERSKILAKEISANLLVYDKEDHLVFTNLADTQIKDVVHWIANIL